MRPASSLLAILRFAAALVLVASLGTWLATGAHRGWTRTSVTEMQHDAVTGIDFPVEHDKFVAGVEFLAVGVGFAGMLGFTSFVLSRREASAARGR